MDAGKAYSSHPPVDRAGALFLNSASQTADWQGMLRSIDGATDDRAADETADTGRDRSWLLTESIPDEITNTLAYNVIMEAATTHTTRAMLGYYATGSESSHRSRGLPGK